MVPGASGRHPSSTPRTRPRSTRTSTRSISRAATGAALWEALAGVFRFWIGQGVTHLPRRQPAHQGVPVLGLGDRRDQARSSPRALPRRGVHAAQGDVPPREARLQPVVHVLHLAQHARPRLREYMTELTRPPVSDFFRPNFWPNTPDILHADLQTGGRAAFEARLVLAATLSSNYGIYGPAYELMRAHAARSRDRGVPRLGEVPAADMGPGPARQPA